MATENKTYELIEPYNPTDPIVVFDPSIKQGEVAKLYMGEKDGEGTLGGDTAENLLTIDGVKVPIITVNNSSVETQNILEFKLEIKEFLPKIDVTILDADGRIQALDVPGMENNLTVILIAPVDGANKKIAMRFYITECKFNTDGTINYKGELKLPNLNSFKNTQIGDSKLSTYEMFEQIAKDNELGFAATEDCKDINDKRWRQLYRQTLVDYMQEQLKFAGKDEDSIFDAWIDEFGYLVLVNVPWVFKYELEPLQLTIKMIAGLNTGTKVEEENKPFVEETARLISNHRQETSAENLYFTKYENVTNNEGLKAGTKNKYYYMKALCSENKMDSFETEIKENSPEAQTEENDYTFENVEFLGFDFTDDDDEENTPIVVQQKNVENFFTNIYSKEVVVTMPKPNYLLQRGMLVIALFEEYNPVAKKAIIENAENINVMESEYTGEENEDIVKSPDDSGTMLDMVDQQFSNELDSVQNPAQTGIYYIKDITFFYNYGDDEILQQMTLVKRGSRTNLNNKLAKLTVL